MDVAPEGTQFTENLHSATSYEEARTKLGLPKESNMEEISQGNEIARDQAVKSYLALKGPVPEFDTQQYSHERSRGLDHVKKLFERLTPTEKAALLLRRTKILGLLTVNGVKNPVKLLNLIEAQSGVDGSLGIISISGRPQLTTYDRQRIINGFNFTYNHISNQDFIVKCKQIGDLEEAVSRLNQIGARIDIIRDIAGSNNDGLLALLQNITKISSNRFIGNLEALKKYLFLFPRLSSSDNSRTAFSPLIQLITQDSEVTESQRQILDIAYKIYSIVAPMRSEASSVLNHSMIGNNDPQILFSNKERLVDELTVLEELVYETQGDLSGGTERATISAAQRELCQNDPRFFSRIDKLAQSGDLHLLSILIQNGFIIGSSNLKLFFEKYDESDVKLNLLRSSIQRGDKLAQNLDESDIFTDILLLADFRKTDKSTSRFPSLEKIDVYEKILENKDSCRKKIQLALEVVDLLNIDTALKITLFNRLIAYDNISGIKLDPHSFTTEINRLRIINSLPPEQQDFWNMLRKAALDTNFISEFLLQNHGHFNEFFKDGKFTDDFLSQFSHFMHGISEEEIEQRNLNRQYIVSGINQFILSDEHAPESLADLINVIKREFPGYDIGEAYKILGVDYDKWNGFSHEGKATIDFIIQILDQTSSVQTANRLLSEELIDSLPLEARSFWTIWKSLCTSETLALFVYRHKNNFSNYFENNLATTSLLFDYASEVLDKNELVDVNAISVLNYGSYLDSFADKDYSFWLIVMNTGTLDSQKFAIEHIDEIKKHLGERGEITPELLTYIASHGKIELQYALLSAKVVISFPQSIRNYWYKWFDLPEKGQVIFNNKLSRGVKCEDLATEIDVYLHLITNLDQSTSPELNKIKDQILDLLLESDNPQESLRKIVTLFERNNLPDFAKKFRIFEILYTTEDANGRSKMDRLIEEKADLISPILVRSAHLRRLDTMYRDLLRINIESANPSLKGYLMLIIEGQPLLEKVETEGCSGLSGDEVRNLKRLLNRMDVLYENSLLERQKRKGYSALPEEMTLESRIAQLREDLHVKKDQRIIDRIAEMFVKPLGYHSLEEVVARMEQVKKEAHVRNLSNPHVTEGTVDVGSGDLLKGMDYDVLEYLIREGSVAREFLGVKAGSDETPFDTDTSMVFQSDLEDGMKSAIDRSLAKGYGDVIVLVRNRNQFRNTRSEQEIDLRYDPTHYEIFQSYKHGDKHYGIRTGFPSTEIDAVILRQPLLVDTPEVKLKRENIFFNVANNGFYIPVVDESGVVLFTEQDFNTYRLDREEIQKLLLGEDFSPKQFVHTLKSSPFLKTLYEMDAGVKEGYTTEEHTVMVMNLFERYFERSGEFSVLTKEEFRLMLALHDIGKPLAVKDTGSTETQHQYTKKILSQALQASGLNTHSVDAILYLVDQDILGDYIKGNKSAEISAQEIEDLAESLGVLPLNLLKTLKMFYICDAGSYTSDAGGQASLDNHFIFNVSDEISVADFSPETETKYQELLSIVQNL